MILPYLTDVVKFVNTATPRSNFVRFLQDGVSLRIDYLFHQGSPPDIRKGTHIYHMQVVGLWEALAFYRVFYKYVTLPCLKMLKLKQFQRSSRLIYEGSNVRLFTGELLGRDIAFLGILQAHPLYHPLKRLN